ncbi:dUTPase [Fusobacterium necrophorum]|uniref:dUTPase n=1 Tax=Fusobacterium necrophorum TaxID=859 RepID=UPI000A60279B|nr:dUTPase [Fusobacterium necrophorum]
MRYIFSKDKYEKRMKERGWDPLSCAEQFDGMVIQFEKNKDYRIFGDFCIFKHWCDTFEDRLDDRLKEIWERQKKFDDIVFKNAKVTREGTTLHRKIALVAEVGEMFNENPDFKCWKKHKNTEVTDALKEEFVDVLHFLISLGIDIFKDEQEMFEWYCRKNNKNLERQKNGY